MSERNDPARAKDDRRLEAYRAGDMTPQERRTFEREMLADPEQAESLFADVSVAAAIADVASRAHRNVVPIPRWWQRRTWQVAVPLAAAALVLLVLIRPNPGNDPVPPTFRTTEAAARIVGPVGDLEEPPTRFVWTPDALAALYRVEIHDAGAGLVHRATTADTVLVVSDDELPAGAFDGYWKVIPMNEAGIERPAPSPAWIRWGTP